jgi:hypothetical protein
MNKKTAVEVGRLKAVELEAERRYGEVVKNSDLTAARNAAERWRKAADALNHYIAENPDPYRNRG